MGKIQARVDLREAKSLHSDFGRILYPSHGFMLEILQALITCTAAAINNPGPDLEPQMQSQRVEWCNNILESLDKLEPGLSLGRGKHCSIDNRYLVNSTYRECTALELLDHIFEKNTAVCLHFLKLTSVCLHEIKIFLGHCEWACQFISI